MASPRLPVQVTLPPLTDPDKVKETFGNHLMGINICDGVVHITVSMIRPKHNNPGGPSDNENVVVSRLTIPSSVMESLIDGYGQLRTAIQLQQTMSKPN